MSIDPNGIYDSFTFNHRLKDIHWTIHGPSPGDLVAGILLGLLIAFNNLTEQWEKDIFAFLDTIDPGTRDAMTNDELDTRLTDEGFDINYPYESLQIEIIHGDEIIELNYSGVADAIRQHYFNGYEPYSPEEFYERGPLRPPEGEFGWVIQRNDIDFVLYSFRTTEFVRGFISILQAFYIDLQDEIFSLPFKYDEKTRTRVEYEIVGYLAKRHF